MEPRHPRGKLRNKIFLLMLLVSVVPILISAFLSVYSITVSHRLDIANLESAVLDLKTREIESFMNMDIAAAFKFTVPFDVTEDLSLEEKSMSLKTAFGRIPWIKELTGVGLDGKEAVKFDRLRPDGVPGSELRDVSGDEGFLYAKKTGQVYVSAVSSTPEGPMVNVAAPITNKNGVVLSVVAGKFLLNGLKSFVGEAGLGSTGYVYLVANNGVLIGGGAAGPAPESNFKNIGIVESVLAGTDFLGPDGQRRYNNFLGEEVVAAGKYIPDYKWGLVAEWPTREADANINSLINKDIVVSLAVLAAVIIVSIVLTILIVRPVRKLEKGTELVARGKFDEKVDIKSGDELEELGQAFNKMMAGLKQLEELKDEFVFIAAHELRTPVAAMKGYLTLILDGVAGPITEKTKEFVNKVINSNQRLIQLVNDLLEVSRSEAGRLTIKVSPVNMSESIDAALSELKPLADQKAMEIRYEIPENLPQVFADPDRVKEVMVNLVGNAVKYSDPKGIVVVSHETQGDYLVTHVKDSGFGISKEAQAKLFEKFYRIQTGKSKEITGTGLGLFIVKEIIEKINGKIWAESEGEGKGSTFSFSLPIAG
jgi:signal transduction histidine kinase